MPDPVTAGAIVASALAMGAEAALKGAVGEAVKDSYKTLKQQISRWLGSDVEALEGNPASAARVAVVAEGVDHLAVSDQEALAELAARLTALLKRDPAVSAMDFERVEAVHTKLRNITAHGTTAIRVGTLITETLDMDGVTAGPTPGKV